ncbi:hypothetical protein [Thalassovita aquimarina]|uniref:Copper resistance protein D domain-containing protein n=1 Tax=Thalassovita aquimarina TaxID=2785917 RepID=A0ABS5HR36_9RHOB|nr:hypothetical protein [Thalassovita aquimarina]MBR9651437.1 hypothetical protein [Thalassovita aquimarina]
MIVVLKTIHFLSLWAAGGIGAGGWIIQSVHARKGARPSAEVVQSLRFMGLLALISVTLLWISGYALAHAIHGGLPTGLAFHVKLVAAAAILLASLGTNLEMLRSMRAATPPRAKVMSTLAWIVRIGLVIVLVSAAITFSGSA